MSLHLYPTGIIVPDAIEPIVSYRGFFFNPEYQLQSVTFREHTFKPYVAHEAACITTYNGSRTARCECNLRYLTYPDECPHERGKCGFYSLIAPNWEYILGQMGGCDFGYAMAEVEIWGKIVEHALGYRSQYLRVKKIVKVWPDHHVAVKAKYDLKEEVRNDSNR